MAYTTDVPSAQIPSDAGSSPLTTLLIAARREQLDEMLASARTPSAAMLVVGVPGSGRSTLLEAVRAHPPIRSAWVSPHPSERDREFAGISLVLGALGDPRVAEFIGRFRLVDNSLNGTLAAALDLLLLLRAGSRPDILLLIDDADQFDDHSQVALAYIAGRLAGTGIRMLMSVSPDAAESTFAGIRQVALSRLDGHTALAFASSLAPANADRETLRIVCGAAGHLPGLITTAIGSLSQGQLEGLAPLSLPLYPGAFPLRLDRWDRSALKLLRRLSIAPLNSMSAIPEIQEGNRDRFQQLNSQGVLDIRGPFVAIRDGALRSAVYWSMTSEQRTKLYRRAVTEEFGHSEALTLWHADHAGENLPASETLIAEAGDLFDRGFTAAAIELTERALLLRPLIDEMLGAMLGLCDRLIILSEFAIAHRYLEQCKRSAQSPSELADCLRLEIIMTSLEGHPIDVRAVDAYARRFAKDAPAASADLLAQTTVFLVAHGEIGEARARIDLAYTLRPAPEVPADSIQSGARRLVDAIDGAGTGPTTGDVHEPVVEDIPAPIRIMFGRALTAEGRYDDARRAFASLTTTSSRPPGSEEWTARVIALSAENEIAAGRVAEASRFIDELYELGTGEDFRTLLLFAWNEIMVREKPDPEAYLEQARRVAAHSRHDVMTAQLHCIEGAWALNQGDLDSARSHFAAAYEIGLVYRPDFLRVDGAMIEVLARLGEWDAATRVTEDFADRVARHPSNWASMALAHAQAIVAPSENMLAGFQKAVGTAMANNAPIEVARIRFNYAMALERGGQLQRAGEQKTASELQFEALSASGWARAVRESSTVIEASLQSSMLSTLTDQELAVLRLMRRGVRNKDIAAALFVSLRTVEVRITQIYRKLEARSRSHLLTILPPDIDQAESL